MPQNSIVEVWLDGRILSVGALSESRTTNKVIATRRVRDRIIEQGFFGVEAKRTFSFCYHFDSFVEWVAYLENANWLDSRADGPLIERVQEILFRYKKGKIVIREILYAACLRRLAINK